MRLVALMRAHKRYRSSGGVSGTGWSGFGLMTDFARDGRGTVMIFFGLTAVALFMFIGAAVDMGRWLNARDATISAVDRAVLAAGRVLQTGGNSNEAKRVADTFYAEAVKSRLETMGDSINFVVANDKLSVTAKGNAYIKTPFMSLAGVEKLPLLVEGGSEYSKAKIASGGNSDTDLEISIMLDVSGSMNGRKLDDLKDAAKDLIDIVVWDNQSEHTSRVALVPFSSEVRPPSDMLDKVVISKGSAFSRRIGSGWYNYDVYFAPTECVAERGGKNAYTDDPPKSSSSKIPIAYHRVSSRHTREADCHIHRNATVFPLSDSKEDLKDHIDGLRANGGTAGHIGTAWTYYMLSPQWTSFVGAKNSPKNYQRKDLSKIAILMTDGEYNYTYEMEDGEAVPVDDYGGASHYRDSINGESSAEQAKSVCENMKKDGIEVYTIGFELGNNRTSIETLESCATTPGHVFNAQDGDQLKKAFREIALRISELYLSQ